MDDVQSAMLEGLNRADLHWNPSINYDLCQNCGVCVNFCKHGVYTQETNRVVVSNPTGCVVLCNNCMPLCPTQAISFPTKVDLLKQIRVLRKSKN